MFYHHRVVGDMLQQGLDETTTPFVRIDGQTSAKDRAARMGTFEQESTCRVGLFSLCATSTGLNLQFCQRIMYAELTFLSVHHTQSEAGVACDAETKVLQAWDVGREGRAVVGGKF
jgi:hypothetical protein